MRSHPFSYHLKLIRTSISLKVVTTPTYKSDVIKCVSFPWIHPVDTGRRVLRLAVFVTIVNRLMTARAFGRTLDHLNQPAHRKMFIIKRQVCQSRSLSHALPQKPRSDSKWVEFFSDSQGCPVSLFGIMPAIPFPFFFAQSLFILLPIGLLIRLQT